MIAYARELAALEKTDGNHLITDAIALKYLQTLGSDADELENTHATALGDKGNKQLMDADRVRDKALLVFRRLMQIYELSEDNSPEAISYEKLNNLWLARYEALPYLSLAVETEGIDNLLLEITTSRYANDLKTLKITESLKKIKETNEAFKGVYADVVPNEQKAQPVYDVRLLRMEMIKTIELFIGYVKAIAAGPDDKEMQLLLKKITQTTESYSGQLASKHSGAIVEEAE